jgi:hypothetical protein
MNEATHLFHEVSCGATISESMSLRKTEPAAEPTFSGQAFGRGAVVLVSLSAPREKFWGMILDLAPAGVSLRGIDLNCFEDFARQVKAGEPVTANAVFFPMHRVERIELDARNGDIPSLQGRFQNKSGCDFQELLAGSARHSKEEQGR